jgi:hypothetical protein
MVKLRSLVVGAFLSASATVGACATVVQEPGPSGHGTSGSGTSGGGTGGGDAGSAVSDADSGQSDAFPIWDAAPFDGYDPPFPGEYPPKNPNVPCTWSGCGPCSPCDDYTGWCCGGNFGKGVCVCGDGPGCVPPAMCCALPGALKPTCVPTATDCPTPW